LQTLSSIHGPFFISSSFINDKRANYRIRYILPNQLLTKSNIFMQLSTNNVVYNNIIMRIAWLKFLTNTVHANWQLRNWYYLLSHRIL